MDMEHGGYGGALNSELLYRVELYRRDNGELFLYARGKMAGSFEKVQIVPQEEAERFVELFMPDWREYAERTAQKAAKKAAERGIDAT